MTDGFAPVARAGAHLFRLRVYYEDTDTGGIVYYANYLKFAERARTEVLRDLGIHQSALMEEAGLAFAVRRCEVDYLSPAKLDDELEVRTALREIGAASLHLDQAVFRLAGRDESEERELARLAVRLAVIKRDGRPTRLPPHIAQAMRRLAATAAGEAQPGVQPETLSTVHPRAAKPTPRQTADKQTANKKRA